MRICVMTPWHPHVGVLPGTRPLYLKSYDEDGDGDYQTTTDRNEALRLLDPVARVLEAGSLEDLICRVRLHHESGFVIRFEAAGD